jgi:RimJ/RimL family protein N-acetyltransferase
MPPNQPRTDFSDWHPCPIPDHRPLEGEEICLVPLHAARHSAELYSASHKNPGGSDLWTYLPVGPFDTLEDFTALQRERENSSDPLHYAILDRSSEKPVGSIAYLRITPEHGVIEIGHVLFTPQLQRTRAATEVIFLMLRHAFDDLGYRRVEWKCDSLNEPSRRAALRFGFKFEGIFRQHIVVKGRNRDTAWYALLDHEWPPVREAFTAWLAPNNFDANGRQCQPLARLRDASRDA